MMNRDKREFERIAAETDFAAYQSCRARSMRHGMTAPQDISFDRQIVRDEFVTNVTIGALVAMAVVILAWWCMDPGRGASAAEFDRLGRHTEAQTRRLLEAGVSQ